MKKRMIMLVAVLALSVGYGIYRNYHFKEEVKDREIVFNYLLQQGRATTRNAIRLLDMLGYDPELVKNAGNVAAEFEHTGVWKKILAQKR